MIQMPIWAFVLLIAGCVPMAGIVLLVMAAFAFRAIDAIREGKGKWKNTRK